MKTSNYRKGAKLRRSAHFGFGVLMAIGILSVLSIAGPAQAETLVIQSDSSWKVSEAPKCPAPNLYGDCSARADWVDCPGNLGAPGPAWTAPGFNDSSWGNSVAPWIELCNPPSSLVKMWMEDLPDGPLEVLFRKTFILNAIPLGAQATIYVDDNYQLYVNGTFVYRKHLPNPT